MVFYLYVLFLVSCDCPFNVLPTILGVNPFICKLEGRGERGEGVRERRENEKEKKKGGEEGRVM